MYVPRTISRSVLTRGLFHSSAFIVFSIGHASWCMPVRCSTGTDVFMHSEVMNPSSIVFF